MIMHRKSKGVLLVRTEEYEKSLLPMKKYIEEEFIAEDGTAEINLDISETELFDKLSMGKQRELNTEIYDYIDKKVYVLPAECPVRIKFYNSKLTPAEEASAIAIIAEHYSLVLQDKRYDRKRARRRNSFLAAFGIIMLAAYFTFEAVIKSPLYTELLSIAGYVALWDVVDYMVMGRVDLREEWLNAGQTALSEVVFVH